MFMATKKNDNKKKTTSVKKKAETKKTTSTKKTATKNTNKKKTKKLDSLFFMKLAFVLLVILVVILSIIVIVKKQESKNNLKANIVIPMVDKEDEAPFSVNLRALNESGEYVFKVTNYNDKKINKEDLNYYIDVQNKTDTKVELTKYGSKDNLLNGEIETTIEGGKVPTEEKKDVYYVVKITSPGKLTKDDYLNIKVRVVK